MGDECKKAEKKQLRKCVVLLQSFNIAS